MTMEVEGGEGQGKTMLCLLTDPDGNPLGTPVNFPLNTEPQHLQQIVNQLRQNEERLPYAFYIADKELVESLGKFAEKNKISVEKVLHIVYQPQAVFRIRPVHRCSATIAGHTEAVLSVAFSPDGQQLASGSGDTTVRLWDLNTQTPLFTCTGHKNWVLAIAWSPDGKYLVSGSKAGELQCWDPRTGKPSGNPLIGHKKWITGISWEPVHLSAPCRRFVSAGKDGDARIWDVTLRKSVICLSGHTLAITCVKWGGDGFIYTGSDDEKVKVDDEMAKNYLAKRKKDSDEGNVESRSAKYRRSDNNNNSASVNVGANANDEEEKRKARLMRNRESAQLSRQRKKHYVEELEDKVRAMHSTIADLNNRISYVMAENTTLKQHLSSGGAMCPPPPPHLGMHPHPPMPPMAYPWMPYSPYVTKPQGSQSLLLPIPRLKSQQPAAAPKSKKSESKKSEGRTKKVASISFLGLLFFILLFGGLVPMLNVNFSGVMDRGFGGSSYVRDRFNGQNRGKLLNVHGHLNGSEEIIYSGISGGKFDVSNKILRERGHHTRNMLKEQGSRSVLGSDEFARLHNTSSEPLVASLYVPRNDKLVKIDGNLIIHSVLASEKAMASHEPFERQNSRETGLAVAKDLVSALAIPKPGGNRGIHAPLYRNSAGPHKALTSGSTDVPKDCMKSTSADGKLQQWFREGLAGPMLSSGMCTEVFQFDVSAATSSGGIIPASSVSNVSEHRQNTTELNRGRNRRILRGLPIPLAGSGHNVTEENVKGNRQNNTLPGNRSASPMVVSVLVDPREAGDIDVDGMIKPKSLSRIFVVVLLDSVKYVTYSCVLPRSGPHLVTT